MIPHYGKREPGALTAASPGDTLIFPFGAYNDSGDSEALSGLAVTDVEVFKDGGATARATDSGYSLISDTGQLGDRVGLYRVRVQLFNTADDASFYATGSHYLVAVDSVTVDGKTVRFYVGQFEIGRARVDLREIIGDTGATDRLLKLAGSQLKTDGTFDTGTGQTANTFNITATATTDTGQVNNAVWNGARSAHTTAGSFGQYVHANLVAVLTDTGAAHLDAGRLGVSAAATVDTGQVNQAVWQGNASRTITSFDVDTGLRDLITDAKNELDTGIKAVLALADTGKIATAVWAGDTGLRDLITDSKNELDTGIKAVLALADTGKIATAVWAGDTGLRDHITNVDTGIMARFDDLAEDTGGVNINAIAGDTGAAGWLKAAFLNGFADTGLNERLARIQSDVDTGLRVHIDDSDTGVKDAIADLDTGLRDHIDNTDTGLRALLALADTGKIATAVWAGDTGLRDHITNVDTGIMARFDDLAEDTGGVIVIAISDTGLNERLDAIEAQTTKLTFDTGNEIRADIRRVNNVTVQGTGDNSDKWRPGT